MQSVKDVFMATTINRSVNIASLVDLDVFLSLCSLSCALKRNCLESVLLKKLELLEVKKIKDVPQTFFRNSPY